MRIEIPPDQIYNAGVLFQVALQSYLGMRDLSGKRIEPGTPRFRDTKWLDKPSLVSTVFAAISLEAFINEAQEIAESSLMESGEHPPQVVAFSSVLAEAEGSRASAPLKFMLASVVLGRPFERGAAPYQDFVLLIRTRDELVHMKPSGFTSIAGNRLDRVPETGGGAKLLAQLAPRNVLMDPSDEDGPVDPTRLYAKFTTWIGTPAMARWSCITAATMVRTVVDLAPESVFKQRLQSTYDFDFRVVP